MGASRKAERMKYGVAMARQRSSLSLSVLITLRKACVPMLYGEFHGAIGHALVVAGSPRSIKISGTVLSFLARVCSSDLYEGCSIYEAIVFSLSGASRL